MLKLALAGAQGKMGQIIAREIKAEPELELVAEITRQNSDHFQPADFEVLIDFSNVAALEDHLKYCVQHNRKLVSGVTGLKDSHFKALAEAATKIAIVYSPNMSQGVNLAFCMIEMAAKALKSAHESHEVVANIHEIHHLAKKDAPSGTALKMQDIIAKAWGEQEPANAVKVSYDRVGEVKGDHSLAFTLKGEQLKLIHQAEDRVIFARGAIMAAKWLAKMKPGLYDMRDVLGLG